MVIKVSVIIPTLNEERYIENTLTSLKKQNFDEDYEIIVVDSYSTDNTIKIAERYADKILFDDKFSAGAARNLGVKNAEARIIAFTDADTIVDKNWLREIYHSFKKDPLIVGVSGISYVYDGTAIDNAIYKFGTSGIIRLMTKLNKPLFPAFNCAYKKKAFLKTGGYPEGWRQNDDFYLSLRISKLGKVVFNKRMIVYTSARRQKKSGYSKLIPFYILNFINLVMKKEPFGTYAPIR